MDKKLFIANWKSNKTLSEAQQFFDSFKEALATVDLSEKEIIIAPPYTLLAYCSEVVKANNLPIKLSSQNVSSFPAGAYTGEINAKQVKEFADYAIVGHSERRKYLHETDNDLENKVREAKAEGLTIIQCIQDAESMIHDGVQIIAYEPPSAIGSGNPDSPEHVSEVFARVLESNKAAKILYGGSVNAQTFQQFMSIPTLSGFLIGGASLESESFISLLS